MEKAKENDAMKKFGTKLLTVTLTAALLMSNSGNLFRVFAEENEPQTSEETQMVPEETQVVHMVEDEMPADDFDYNQILATIYNCETCNWYAEADTTSAVLGTLDSGQQVRVLNAIYVNGTYWYQVEKTNEAGTIGYVEERYLISTQNLTSGDVMAVSDENITVDNEVPVLVQASDDFESSISGFPESYKPYLRNLHAIHPNWIFVPQNTGIDWNTFIAAEMEPERSLIERSVPDAYKGKQSWAYNPETGEYYGLSGYNWVQASESAVKYYADPRNFLDEQGIFQFELLGYNGELQTEAGVEAILSGTFMSHTVMPGDVITYAQAFCKVGQETQTSPYMLAARVRQEQGTAGTSPLISGCYPGYENLYNFFNIGAYGSTSEEIYVNGLTRARTEGWNTRFNSIQGGARILSGNYISKAQDTLYLQKFHVVNNGYTLFTHQYMQNIRGAVNEAKTAYNTYNSIGILDNALIFKIPVYTNMPAVRCPKPDEGTNQELEAFVKRLYSLILGRGADEQGLANWTYQMQENGMTAAQVVEGFVYSPEFTNRSISDDEYIEIMYQCMLNRGSDSAGKANWKNALEQGASRRYVLAGFTNSQEFMNLCNSYNVIRGSLSTTENRDINLNTTAFVSRLYRTALQREPEVQGLNEWTGRLYRHETDLYGISVGFICSPEFTGHNYSNEEYVTILYRTFLDRDPDSQGLKHWMGMLNHGSSRLEVMQGFAYSPEFQNLAASYGL